MVEEILKQRWSNFEAMLKQFRSNCEAMLRRIWSNLKARFEEVWSDFEEMLKQCSKQVEVLHWYFNGEQDKGKFPWASL